MHGLRGIIFIVRDRQSFLTRKTDNPFEQGKINDKNMATCCYQNTFIKYNCLKKTVSPMDAGKNRDIFMGTIFRLFKDRALITLFL